MTVAALTPAIEYLENGVSLSFPVPFRFLSGAHLEVKRIGSGGTVTTLAFGVDYSVIGGETDAGGTLTLVSSTSGATLKIRRATPRDQQTDYETNDNFPADTTETRLDQLTMVAQEQDVLVTDVTARAILAPEGEAGAVLPPRSELTGGGKVLGPDPVTGTIAVLDGSAFKGDPGGNAATIGLWSIFATLVIGDGIDQVQTDGYSVRGWGAARYVLDTDQVSLTSTVWRKKSANDRWFVLARDQRLTLAMFGALPDYDTDAVPAFEAAFAFGQFPLHVEPGPEPYRFITASESGVVVPGGAVIDATGAEIKLDATGLPDDFRYAFDLDGCASMLWTGGTMTRQATLSGLSFGGGDGAGRIRIERFTDRTRGPVFTATPIANGTAATITATSDAADSFTVPAHGLADGELISLYREDGANSLYSGLETHRDYYAIVIDANTFKVAETETLALAGVPVTWSAAEGAAPDRIRKGLVPSESLELVDYRCESAGAGPHMFGMWKRVLLKNLTGDTEAVQLFQFERPGGGVWLTWGHPMVSDVEDVDVEASALGGVEWTHCHEINAKRIKVRRPNRLRDGTLMGFKPEAPNEAVAYAGISVGARTRVLHLEDCWVEGAPLLTADGPRAGWSGPTECAGIAIHHPHGHITLENCGGIGNYKSDLDIFQTAGDGYTRHLRRGDRIVLRKMQLKSATPVTVTPLASLPPIEADESVEAFGRNFTTSPPFFALQGWNTVGPDGAQASWLNFGAAVTVDTADKQYGFGSVKYRGSANEFNYAEFPLDKTMLAAGLDVIVYALVKLNSAKFASAPTFVAVWEDEVGPAIVYPFFNIGVGELITDEWVVARTVLPASTTTNVLRLCPHFNQATPVVSDPDWYFKIGGLWIWTATNGLDAPGVDLGQPMTTNGAPTLGTHPLGRRYPLANPAAGGNIGMVCTAAGSPGTWKTYGAVAA